MPAGLLHYSDIESAYDHPERIGRLAGLIDTRRDKDTLVVGTGDNTSPGVLPLLTEGRQALEFFSRVSPDLEVPGNHDFDHGVSGLRSLIRDSPQRWVCANAYLDNERFGTDVGVVPSVIESVGGHRLGFVGLLDPATPAITPEADQLRMTGLIDTAKSMIRKLRGQGVDSIILLSHTGQDRSLAQALDVDLILGGHVHDETIDRVDGTVITRPGENAQAVIECRYADGHWEATRLAVDSAPLNTAVADALQQCRTAENIQSVIETTPQRFVRTRERIVSGEAQIGSIVAESYRWATDADIGLQNSGGIRTGPPLEGEITAGELIGIVPFDEPVSVARLAGETLRQVLAEIKTPAGYQGYVSGVELDWANESLTDVSINGQPLETERVYTMATSEYLFFTDREFRALTPSHRSRTSTRAQYQVLIDYLSTVGLRNNAQIDREIRP